MKPCLFCESEGPYSSREHIIPESLGNNEHILEGEVCDKCNDYFGHSIEEYVLNKTPIAFWRTFLRIKTKDGDEPNVDLSQPKKDKGVFPSVHPKHDDIGFSSFPDGAVSVDLHNEDIVHRLLAQQRDDDEKGQFRIVMTPKLLQMLGRFLCKIGIEILCEDAADDARQAKYDAARQYAREGHTGRLWPIFHYSAGEIGKLKAYAEADSEVVEHVKCYSYSLVDFENWYTLFAFSMGTDNWIVSLNDPYPTPQIRRVIPNDDLNLLWYPSEQW